MLGIFGEIKPPIENNAYFTGTKGSGIFLLLSNLFKLAGVIAGIFFIVQVILAGFNYLSANGDPKKTEVAFAKIWQSMIGLAIVASAFVIASVIGRLTGINILNPTIYGPGQ
ncbi:MAG: hypothetical protein WC895_01060 [Candidatus Shapirobacteria bacterium]|jgi:hypothetical protein